MKKETFVKLIKAWQKEQKRLKGREKEIDCYSFVEDVFEILSGECEFYWWVTQTPARAFFDGKLYSVETPEEFYEYTKIVKKGLRIK